MRPWRTVNVYCTVEEGGEYTCTYSEGGILFLSAG